ncbi:MAG: ABC transporter ATP-binding protein [Candidatus Heimdallarchaeota archaeon]|nr:MAG: ABC transporter ATP-binding protein [Candidatus Heimdallarchaeota archaeon]
MQVPQTVSTDVQRRKFTPLPTKKYRSATHWYLSFFWRSPGLVLLSLGMSLISAFLILFPSILLGQAFSILQSDGFSQAFLFACLGIIISALLSFVITFVTNYSWTVAAFRYERDTRQEFFDIVQEHSMTFHDEIDSSSLLSMAMNEISQMRMGVNPSMRMLSGSLLSMIFITIVFLAFDPAYFLIALLGFPLYILLVVRYASVIGPIREELASRLAVVTRDSQEIFRGIEVVRSFNQEDQENKRFASGSTSYADIVTKEGRLSAFFWPALVLIALTAIIFGLGLINLAENPSTIDTFTSSVSMLLSLQFINFMLPMAILNIRAGKTNADRIWLKMTWKDPVPDTAQEGVVPDWGGDIVFDDVSFNYGNSTKSALKNINLTISSGSRVAIIGGPGSGKSTFLKLLLRLYDPTEGEIKINGTPLTEIPAGEIRQGVTMVEQEVFLFSASVRENIAFADPNASDEEIASAAKNAQALTFIEKLPQGFETRIGERGSKLSGGQRQRIAIARAILADPKVLLLDDSVSAIDSKTELLLRRALDKLMEDRTSIVVTQRLRTLIESDFVVLFDKGEICAYGPHDKMLESCPQYQTIFEALPEVVGGPS